MKEILCCSNLFYEAIDIPKRRKPKRQQQQQQQKKGTTDHRIHFIFIAIKIQQFFRNRLFYWMDLLLAPNRLVLDVLDTAAPSGSDSVSGEACEQQT